MSSYYEKMLATGEVKCIDEEIPFEIPQGWEWTRIRNISQSYIGLTYSPSDVSPHGTIVLRSSNIQDGKIILNDVVRVAKSISEKLRVEKNDIIICARNGSAKLVGKSAIVKDVVEPMTFGAFMAICKTSLYQYVSIFLQSDLFFSQLRGVSGTTTINQLTQSNFNSFLIALPPIEEQYRIFEKVSDVLPIVEVYGNKQRQLDSLNDNLRENIKKAILQEAIQGKLVPQITEEGTAQELLEQIKAEKQKLVKEGKLKKSALNDSVIFRGDDNKYWEKSGDNIVCIGEEIPFGIPSSWSWCRLGNIASVKGGKRIPVGEKLTTENTGHMYIRVADMKENTVKTDDIHYISESIYQKIKSYTISTEDLYITVAGTIGSVGEIPKVFDNANLTENADKIVFRGICKKFLMYCLLSNFVQSQIKKCTTKVGQPKLAIVRIEDLLIPLPPIKEQYRIVHKIEQTASIMS